MIKQDKFEAARGRVNFAMLLVAAAITILAVVGISVLIASLQRNTDAASISAPAPKTERLAVAIEGMSCAGCAAGIKAMLKRTSGVVSAEVSFENKEAVVEFNPAETSSDKIIEAINNLGYKASVKE